MEQVWAAAIENIKSKISELNYDKWLKPVTCLSIDDTAIRLSVPNQFVCDWIKDYYLDAIRDGLMAVSGRFYDIKFEIKPQLDTEPVEALETKEERVASAIAGSAPAQGEPPKDNTPWLSLLAKKYSFDRFVVGSQNQLAAAAAKAVADLPGGHYNPLFVYGGVGLGKTHLINAIGIAISERFPAMRVIYISSERFMNELINSIRYEKMADFRKKYRDTCDVLLMDDIQFIAGKERTQEEFFHTFNCLHEMQKQIVVTSDKFPKEMSSLEDRLKSRFEWGLIVDIQPPDLETRIAILKKKAEVENVPLSDDVALYLATNIKSNVRELEGSLIRLSAYSSFSGEAITVDMAKEKLKNIIEERSLVHSIESIQKLVADKYQLKTADLKSPRRTKNLALPRQIAMYLCKKHLRASFPEIGNKFGGKDHTTVLHACRKIERLIKDDVRLREEVAVLEHLMIN